MISSQIVQERLYKNFYRPHYIDNVFGIQAQNIDAAAISMSIRNSNITYDQFHNHVIGTSFFRTWGPRNTLHIYNRKYFDLLYAFNLRYGNWFEKKWKKEDPELYYNNIDQALALCYSSQTLSRNYLVESGISPRLVDNWGGIFIDLCQKGVLLPAVENKKTQYTCIKRPSFDVSRDLWEKICYLYFESFGPATCSDFAHWLSIDLQEAKAIINRTNSISAIDHGFYSVNQEKYHTLPVGDVIITAKFDNIFLAYSDKSWIVEKKYFNQVWIKSGLVEATIISNNKVIGTWRYKRTSKILAYIKLFYDVDVATQKLIAEKITILLKGFWQKPCDVYFVEHY